MMNDVQTLGDVHLERHFRTGVPLHRIGDREKMVWEQFENEVMNPTGLLHVQMGDLFNEFSVSEATVLRAAEIYYTAAVENPDVRYVILRGNHDAARDSDKKSSFDVLAALLEPYSNILILTVPYLSIVDGKYYGFLPWHPFKSSTELATELINKMRPGEEMAAVFCHCDIKSFGGTDDNLIPINVLKHRTKLVYTGHIHYPQEFEQDGVKVVVTGSMQPYAHGEDPSNRWYTTVSYKALIEMTTLEMFKNVNVRVLIDNSDQVVPEFDCLSMITKRIDGRLEADEDDSEQVVLESFDMTQLFKQSLAEHNVGGVVAEKILNKFSEKKHA